MSQSVHSDDAESTVKSVQWLERNAARVDVSSAREEKSESWKRGKSHAGSAEVDLRADVGAAIVELPDGDPHATLLVEADGGDRGPFAGACDCEGWRYHDGPCAHLVVRAVRSVLRSGEVPVDVARFEELDGERDLEQCDHDPGVSNVGGLDDAAPDRDDDARDQETSADGGDPSGSVYGEETVDQPAEPVDPEPEPDVVDVDPGVGGPRTAMPDTAGDPFAAELSENVPERFVMELRGDTYVRRAGYAAIARNANLRVTVDDVTPAEDTDFTHARYKAVVRDADGEVLGEDWGTAHLEHEDLSGAEAHLDELASTRAIRRALEWATGAGSTLDRGGSP